MSTPAFDLDTLELLKGSHGSVAEGVCAMEAVAWLAGEPHSDHPKCTCPVIATFVRHINDAMPDSERGRLKPYLPRLIGTRAGLGIERSRAFCAADFAVRIFAPQALRAAGLEGEAKKLEAIEPINAAKAANAAANAAHAADAAAHAADAAITATANAADAAAFAADAFINAATYTITATAHAAHVASDAAHATAWRHINVEACLDAMLAVKE